MKYRSICLFFCCFFFIIGCKKDNHSQPEKQLLPKVITYPISDLNLFSVKVKGAVIDSGASKVTEAGFVVGTDSVPTITKNLNKFVRTLEASGELNLIITSIPASQTFYLRAYAKNANGIAYGNEIQFTSLDQKVFNGDVTLSTQQEVIAFGANHYTTINGSLEITRYVTDLTPLSDLAIINYALVVRGTTALSSLNGLNNLQATNNSWFYHGMRFENNTALKSLEGLNHLLFNNGDLYIVNNDLFTDLEGLNNISSSHFGEVRIEGCDNLRSLKGLDKLAWLDGNVFIKDNPLLTDIKALQNLSFITDRISIINNSSLQNLDGLEKVHKVDYIELFNNSVLRDIKGLSNLDTVGSINLKQNTVLADLSPFKNITTLEYLTITDSPIITEFTGFNNLKTITKLISISYTGVINMKGLESLTSAEQVEIYSNDKLENLQGFNNLSTVSGFQIRIDNNYHLLSLSGLEKIATIKGWFSIHNNTLLTEFCAIKPLFKSGWNGSYTFSQNAYNPTKDEILTNCQP